VTVTFPVPGTVELPITHVQAATPFASAVRSTRPLAVLRVPRGVTYAGAHRAPGLVRTVALAWPPGGPPRTSSTAAGAWTAGFAGCATGTSREASGAAGTEPVVGTVQARTAVNAKSRPKARDLWLRMRFPP
jgi:hypothetical protein